MPAAQNVTAVPAFEPVIFAMAEQTVVTVPTDDDVGLPRTVEDIIATCA